MTDDALVNCNGCGAYRLCREYKGLMLCVSGPAKCYRHRQAVYAKKREEGKV